MARVGAVRSAAGPWHPVWQPDDERLPTIAERQAMATQAEAVEYALEEIAQSYADHYAGDLDLRVTRFAPSELEGLQRFDDPDARGPRRRYYLA